MTEFGVAASLKARVDERSLRKARQLIEEEIGDVTVEVNASAAGGGGRGQTVGRGPGHSQKLQTEANRLKESNIDLDEYRNELLEEILDTLEDNGYDDARRRRPPGAGAVSTLLLGGAGAAAVAAAGLSTAPDWVPIDVPRPDWLSALDFPDPSPPPVPPAKPGDEPPREPPKNGPPNEEPAPEPNPTPDPDPIPDGPTGPPQPIRPPSPGDDTPNSPPIPGDATPYRSPGPVPTGPNDAPAPKPDPSPTPDRDPGEFLDRPSGREVLIGGAAGAGVAGAAAAASRLGGSLRPTSPAVGSSVGVPAVGAAAVAQTANRAREKERGNRGPIEQKLLEVLREAGIGQQTASVTADVTNEINLDGVSQNELNRAMEQAKEDAIREINSQFNGGGVI